MTQKTWKPVLLNRTPSPTPLPLPFREEDKSEEKDVLLIYAVECLDKEELVEVIAASIHEKHGESVTRWFEHLARRTRYRADILTIARDYIAIVCLDDVENCLYCEDVLDVHGLYCDALCEQLAKEENP